MDEETKWVYGFIVIIVSAVVILSVSLYQYNYNETKDLVKTGVLVDVLLDLEGSPEKAHLYFEDGIHIFFRIGIHTVYAKTIQYKGKNVTLNYISHALLIGNEFVSIEETQGG